MILLKIAVTILVVTGLSLVAERVSPRAAGILSGYPAGTAISLFFIGLEQGPAYAGQTALYNIAGMTVMLFFLFLYFQISRRVRGRFRAMLAASLGGIPCFLLAVAGLHALRLPAWAGVLLTLAAIPVFIRLFRAIPNTTIARRVTFGPRVLLFRAVLAASVILMVTGTAHLVGPGLAGLLSAFPATVFPLILIIHSTYGPEQTYTIIKHVPRGLPALVLYALSVAAAYPRVGIGWGTFIAFAAATLHLLYFYFSNTAIIERHR